MRVGIGFDTHPLIPGRKLVLGGVEIPFHRGLSGWSDADALLHAIIDALLGAAALGDIGQHFPPGDTGLNGISSVELLKRTASLLADSNWQIVNIDATIVTEAPKLQDYEMDMRKNIGSALNIKIEQVSVKAKTSAKMGFIGRGEGVASHAVVLIDSR